MKTAILILNWNGGGDTVNCVESLTPNLTADDFVFIIDNDSKDNSVKIIQDFLMQNEIPFVSSDKEKIIRDFDRAVKFYCIQNELNLGFGAGNNVLLKQLNKIDDEFNWVWLLNNDALIEAETLNQLKNKILSDEKIGAVGSIVLNYPDISIIQNTGVKYFPLLGVSKLINKNEHINDVNFNKSIEFDYLNGASLMLRREAVDKAGYFDERYFVYSEEFDLQLSLKKKNYKIELEPKSKVYHKLMGSTRDASHLFFYYYCMSSTLLTKKHYSRLTLIIATFNLSVIMIVRTFPSAKNFYWSIKGILKGLI